MVDWEREEQRVIREWREQNAALAQQNARILQVAVVASVVFSVGVLALILKWLGGL